MELQEAWQQNVVPSHRDHPIMILELHGSYQNHLSFRRSKGVRGGRRAQRGGQARGEVRQQVRVEAVQQEVQPAQGVRRLHGLLEPVFGRHPGK